MLQNLQFKARLGIACLLAVALCVFTLSATAQIRKKKKPSVRKPSVVSQPVGEPLIISRADDFSNGSTPVLVPQPINPGSPTTGVNTDDNARALLDLETRIKSLESGPKGDPDGKQKRLLLNLDILNRAEQRTEALRKQVFDLMEKENTVKTRLDVIDNDMRPESIERSVAFAGSLRPEELRASRRKSLETEKANLQNLLTEIQRTRSSLDLQVQKADAMVEKLRDRLEKEIDSALDEGKDKPR